MIGNGINLIGQMHKFQIGINGIFFFILTKKKKKKKSLIMHIERVMLLCVYHLYMIRSMVIFFELLTSERTFS